MSHLRPPTDDELHAALRIEDGAVPPDLMRSVEAALDKLATEPAARAKGRGTGRSLPPARRVARFALGAALAVTAIVIAGIGGLLVDWPDRGNPGVPAATQAPATASRAAPSDGQPRIGTFLEERPLETGDGADALRAFGSVWLSNAASGEVVRVDPRPGASRITRIQALAPGLASPHLASDGRSVWITSEADQALVSIDPATNRVTDRIDLGFAPTDMAIRDDIAWLLDERELRVARVDLTTGGVLQGAKWVRDPAASIAASADAVWVSTRYGVLSRLDPDSLDIVAERAQLPGYVVDLHVDGTDLFVIRDVERPNVSRLALDGLPTDGVPSTVVNGPPGRLFSIIDERVFTADPDTGTITELDARSLEAVGPVAGPFGLVRQLVATENDVWVVSAEDSMSAPTLYRVRATSP